MTISFLFFTFVLGKRTYTEEQCHYEERVERLYDEVKDRQMSACRLF